MVQCIKIGYFIVNQKETIFSIFPLFHIKAMALLDAAQGPKLIKLKMAPNSEDSSHYAL